ncbi:MAG: NAD-dependent epimerase/dehydratase family protein [Rhodospirillales bacterium]|nr:NAD-dependent epimerase/dehydratase family protein [Rhodospirillales bacterium]
MHRLVQEGHAVKVIDNDFRGRARRLDAIAGQFEHVTCDVRDAPAISMASRGADSILHLAAINGTENFYKRPELVLDVGIRGMQSVLEACRTNAIPQLLLMSSSEVYQTPPTLPTPETVPLMLPDPWNPRYSYGGSKIISEVMLGCFQHDALKQAMIIRPHNVYGPDMGYEHVLPQLIMKVAHLIETEGRSKLLFPIQGTGEQTRSFIHISDFIDGVMLVLEKGQHREVYHVGTEEEISIRHVVEEIFKYFKREFELVKGPLPAGGTLRRCPSIQKMHALGFAPRTALEYGIAEMAEWYLSNRSFWPGTGAA